MKIRSSHVSNSSSSSFIVQFPHKPTSKQDLATMMGECEPIGYDFTSEEVVNEVWQCLGDSVQREPESFDDFVEQHNLHNLPYIIDDIIDELEITSEKANVLTGGIQKLIMDSYIHETGFTGRFMFSDDYAFGCAMEHGNVFRNLPHTVISHH